MNHPVQSNEGYDVQSFKYLTKVSINGRLFSRTVQVLCNTYNIIVGQPKNEVIIHDGHCRITLNTAMASVCSATDTANLKKTIDNLLDIYFGNAKVNDKPFCIVLYLASNTKLDHFKYGQMIKDMVTQNTAQIRNQGNE